MKKLDKKGSILVMAVSIILLILIILGICLSIALSYQSRAVNEHARKQAYLSGLSVAQSIAGQIAKDSSEANPYLPSKTIENEQVNLTVDQLPNGTGKDISVVIKYDMSDQELLYIQVTSSYNNVNEKIQLTMQLKDNVWYTKVYSKIGDEFNEEK